MYKCKACSQELILISHVSKSYTSKTNERKLRKSQKLIKFSFTLNHRKTSMTKHFWALLEIRYSRASVFFSKLVARILIWRAKGLIF